MSQERIEPRDFFMALPFPKLREIQVAAITKIIEERNTFCQKASLIDALIAKEKGRADLIARAEAIATSMTDEMARDIIRELDDWLVEEEGKLVELFQEGG